MSAINTAYAMDQDFPALPKWLFVMLTECAGMAEIYDVETEHYMHRCGMSKDELREALIYLDRQHVLLIEEELQPPKSGWRIRFVYPGEYDLPREYVVSRSAAPKKQADGWLYIIGTSHNVTKVGITEDLPTRVKSITTNAGIDAQLVWSFQCKMDRARDLEKAILGHFASERFKGEWVRKDSSVLIAFAKTLVEQPPP